MSSRSGGGVFTYLSDLTRNTIEQCDITIVHGIREQTPEDYEQYFSNSIKLIKSQYMKRKIKLSQEIKAVQEIKHIIQEIKPDVIHLHSSKASIIGRIAAIGSKIKLIYTPHGFSFLMKDITNVKRMLYWLIEKVAMLKPVTIVGCSAGEYKEALKLTKRAICINNGIDIEEIETIIKKMGRRKTDNQAIKICTIGRIDYQKNPQRFNDLAKKIPEAQFTWIGDGDLRDCLTNQNVVITGWKTREEVLEILNDNDIFVLTSLWEGLPIALLEAMYLQKVCIVNDVIGNNDVIENEKNGFISYHDEYADIVNSLKKHQIDTIVHKAKKDVEEKYNWENNIKKYIQLYEKGSVK